MAEDIWAQFRDTPKETSDKEVGRTGKFALAPKNDPWAQYREEQKTEKESFAKYSEKDTQIAEKMSKGSSWLPGHKTINDLISPSLMKGVPGVRQFVPQTKDLSEFEKNDPYYSATGLNAAGAVGSTIAPIAGVSAKLAAKGLPGIIPEMAGQGLLGAGLNTADKVAQKGSNTSKNDFNEAIISGLIGGAAGPAMGKAISPAFNSNRYTVEQLAKHPEQHLERVLRPSSAKDAASAVLNHPLTTSLGGAGIAAITGLMHPGIGAAVGFAAPGAMHLGTKYLANKTAHDVTTQAIINALTQHAGGQYNQ